MWALVTPSDPVAMHLTVKGGHVALRLVDVLLEPLENDVLVVQLPLDQPCLLLDPQHAAVQLIRVVVLLLLLLQEALVAVRHRGRALHGSGTVADRLRGRYPRSADAPPGPRTRENPVQPRAELAPS
jgi:hypothetical protein